MVKKLLFLLLIISFISCEKGNSDNDQKAPFSDGASTLFSKVDSEASGIKFQNNLKQTPEFNFLNYMYIYTGAGIGVGDIDNDGLEDLYFASNMGPNKLYKNQGNLSFEDITSASKTDDYDGFTTGVNMIDINNDGWLDIYLCKAGSLNSDNGRRNKLFVNQQDGTFKEEAKRWGLDDPGYSTQIYPIDYDNDGDLDLYLVNHRYDFVNNATISGKIQSQIERITSDQLYRNDGDIYTNVTGESKLWNKTWGLSAVVSDFNNDGWDDIFVANDFLEPDVMYINQKDGTFKNEINERINHISTNSMGSDYADLNNDLNPDLITVDMLSENYARSKENMASMSTENFMTMVEIGYHHAYMANMLHINVGNGRFKETAQLSGVVKTDWSWAPLLADFDNDGLKDIFVSNGVDRDYTNQDARNALKQVQAEGKSMPLESVLGSFPSTKMVNAIYKNEGDLIFSKVKDEWGLNDPTFSYGAAYADLDNDGDLEIITNNIDGKAGLYRNNSNMNSIQVALEGPANNRYGVGSKIYITTDKGYQLQQLYPSRGYESSVSYVKHFGLGNGDSVQELTIEWPDGKVSKVTNPKVNEINTINYSTAQVGTVAFAQPARAKKSYTSSELGLQYTHVENEFNDYDVQLLIPQKQSTKGTGLTTADVNGDGLDDFFVGNAKGAPAALYVQNADGTFSATNSALWSKEAQYEDANALFFDADADGDQDLYVVSAGYELEVNSPLLQDRLYLNNGSGNFTLGTLPSMRSSGKAIAAADYDGDGDMDLFVGGNVVPGQYPNPPQSFLLQNDGGTFTDVTEQQQGLAQAGMISDALFTDYDSDGDLDLMMVGEWMSPTVFANNSGAFSKVENISGLEQSEGWWFSITQGDFDGDGDPDYIFGNLGKNNKFQPKKEKPLFIYAKDFDGNGSYDVAMSKYNEGKLVPVRGKECSSEQNPYLLDKIKTYKQFASMEFKDIYGEDRLKGAFQLQVHTMETVYAQNNGDGSFTLTPLPNSAQIGPTLAMIVKDFNADGNLDVMGVGAIYDAEVETIRYDSNYGYVLLGDGTGKFTLSEELDPFVDTDAKDMAQLSIAGKAHYVVVSNNEPLEVFTFNP